MIFIVNDIFISRQCPKSLSPLCQEVRKTLHYEFEDEERLERFANHCSSFVGNIPCRSISTRIAVTHQKTADGGTISIGHVENLVKCFVSISYFKLCGRVEVSRHEPLKVYTQDFIKEGEQE